MSYIPWGLNRFVPATSDSVGSASCDGTPTPFTDTATSLGFCRNSDTSDASVDDGDEYVSRMMDVTVDAGTISWSKPGERKNG
jgi:hypothetical protein